MRYRLSICLSLILFVAACQGPPPTQIVLVVTATSENQQTQPTLTTVEVQQAATQSPTVVAATAMPQASPTFDPFPTPTVSQIQVAEQVFEHGRMMWIQPRKQIWVMVDDGSGKGKWSVFEDTFQDGETEFDPSLVPPDNKYQPERGFGKIWRENQAIHDGLGWGLTPEFGYVSNYEYHPGGTVTQGQFVPGAGYHILFSLSQEKFQFNEADYTWKKL
ncbi:MAG: hypothetical protein ABI690_02360 [Chloroflexota bacterium]